MPSFDLRYIQVAKYNSDENGNVSYGEKTKVGDAMTVLMELAFAEGRLYAEGTLAEMIREATGGTISVGVKRILNDAQKLMYGFEDRSRTVNGKPIAGLLASGESNGNYVGISFYAPDKIDGATKYTCMFAKKAMFGPPSYSYTTKGQNITFNTPTTTGEFMGDDSEKKEFFETAVCDTIAEAKAWCDGVLNGSAAIVDAASAAAITDPEEE